MYKYLQLSSIREVTATSAPMLRSAIEGVASAVLRLMGVSWNQCCVL